MEFVDRQINCLDCQQPFTFTAGEQEFYASRGLMNEPGRCPECRAARRGGQGGGARSYGGGGGYGGGEREMSSATCSNCGKEALVPFQPRTDRPVYCSDCFEQVRATRPSYR